MFVLLTAQFLLLFFSSLLYLVSILLCFQFYSDSVDPMASFSIRIPFNCRTSGLLPPLPSPLSFFACIHFSPLSTDSITPSPSPPDPQTPHPPISLFLLTECEFSPTQISKIMKFNKSLLKTASPHTAREASEFLKQWGFTQTQIHNTILRHPPILQCKVDTQLKPKFHFFRTLGFRDQEISNLISICPRVLSNNLEKNIVPKVSFLENLFGTKQNLSKALKWSPALLVGSIEKNLKPKLDFFKQWGIQGELLSLLLKVNSAVLVRYSIDFLRARMEYATNTMGIVQGSKTFVYAICVLLNNRPDTVEKKMKHLQCLGFMEDEVRELLKKNPKILDCSTNKMQENMDFLTQTAGFKPNVVVSNSYLLLYSVKKRLMPRHAIFKAISAEQQSVPSLLTIFKLNERSFLQRFVEWNSQASMLKEMYKAKLDSADIGTT